MGRSAEELVLEVRATEELLARQLKKMGDNVDLFEQSADKAIERLEQRFSGINLRGAVNAIKEAEGAFKSRFASMGELAGRLAETVAAGGRIDLSPIIEQSRNRVALMEAEATVMETLLRAEESRLAPLQRLSTQEAASLAAGRAALAQSREKASAAAQEAARLEALQAQIGQTAVAQRRLGQSSALARTGVQQAGFQVQDFVVQIAGGTSAMRAFTLQAPQMVQAMVMMAQGAQGGAGKFQAFARFLQGGWGVALGVAIPLMAMAAERLFEMGDEAEKSQGKVDGLTQALARLARANGNVEMTDLGRVRVEAEATRAAIRRLDGEIEKRRRSAGDNSFATAFVRATPGAPAPSVTSTLATRASGVDALVRRRAELEARLTELTSASRVAEMQIEANRRRGALVVPETASASSRAVVAPPASARDQSAIDKVAASARDDLARATDELLDRYDEGRVRLRAFTQDFETLQKAAAAGLVTAEQARALESGILLRQAGFSFDDPINGVAEGNERMREGLERIVAQNEEAARRVDVAWHDAAQGVIDSMRDMTNSIEDGGFLDILSAAIGLFTQLGGLGLFGKGIQQSITANRATPRAAGGPVSAGQPYLVGERGPELFLPSSSGRIISNSDLRPPRIPSASLAAIASQRAAPVRILVEANDYFDARVETRAAGVATPIGIRAAQAGAALAQDGAARQRRLRIPGRF